MLIFLALSHLYLTLSISFFLFCIVSYNYGIDNTNVRNEYTNEISRQGVSNNIFFFHSNIQLWPILKYSNYFIRASITDGDSNAVREALALNNIVFSTDCVKRPKNCILYRTGDPNDLVEKVSTTLNKNIKNSRLEIFKGCCHNVHLEQPDKFNILIKNFLD